MKEFFPPLNLEQGEGTKFLMLTAVVREEEQEQDTEAPS
jgi:hypothetical protein